MGTKKPVFVYETFWDYYSGRVNSEVVELVNKLKKDGYQQIKVIEHNPLIGDGVKTRNYFSTTVIACLDNSIDIGYNPPK